MPTANLEKLHEQAQALKQQLKEKGESMDATERRKLGKRVRRLQRKRRRLMISRKQPAVAEAAAEEKKEA